VQSVDERGLARVLASKRLESAAEVASVIAGSEVPKIRQQSQRLVVPLRLLGGDQVLHLAERRRSSFWTVRGEKPASLQNFLG